MKCCPNYIWNSIVNVPPDIDPGVLTTNITFADINSYGFDINDVSNWNTLLSSSFTSVSISGNTAFFNGPTLQALFLINDGNIISIIDNAGILDLVYLDGCFSFQELYSPSATQITCSNAGVLVTVTAPSMTVIQANAFYLSSLAALNTGVITSIGDNAFVACQLTSISIPSCTSIGVNAFQGSQLQTISAQSCTSLGLDCFSGCGLLSSVSLPSLSFVPVGAFAGCVSLANLDITSCTDLGGSPGNDLVFNNLNLTGTLTITIDSSQQTIDGGNPDGDLVSLIALNPGDVTINYV